MSFTEWPTQFKFVNWHIVHLDQLHDTLQSGVFEESQLLNKLMSPSLSKVYISPGLSLTLRGFYNILFLEFLTHTIKPLSLGVYLALMGVVYFLFLTGNLNLLLLQSSTILKIGPEIWRMKAEHFSPFTSLFIISPSMTSLVIVFLTVCEQQIIMIVESTYP